MITCRNIHAGYGTRRVLHGLNFHATAGETVALLGPNGSGKTTLLRTLSGVLHPTHGSIELGSGPNAAPLAKLSPRQRAQVVAVVPQRVEHLPHLQARDMVLLGRYPYLSWWGVYSAADHAAADSALTATRAQDLAQRFLEELSGGELQRVLLARALAQESPVLLLDELSAGLDVARMKELFDLLEMRRRAGTCVVTVMHDMNLAALYSTRLVGLQQGRILFDGPVAEVFTQENLSKLYETPIHVFPHPVCPVPQACPGACGTFTVSAPPPDPRGHYCLR
ncbi:MAG: ABC transporter ATP-binding protein [Desulfovibrionaceae bacterium]